MKLAACAICHSDITYMEGGFGGDLPLVFGHEAAGVVAEVGAGVDDVSVGDHAVVTLIRSCGSCRHCQRGEEVSCITRWPLDERSPIVGVGGERLGHGLRTGAFAEEVVVDRSQIVTIGRYILDQELLNPEASGDLSSILYDIALTGKMIALSTRPCWSTLLPTTWMRLLCSSWIALGGARKRF